MKRMRGSRFARTGIRRAKRPVYWITDVFDNSVQLINGSISEYSIVEYDDWEASSTIIRRMATLRRVIIRGGLLPVIRQDLTTILTGNFWWALYVIDIDDTDADIGVGGQGSILQSNRVLQVGMLNYAFLSMNAAPSSPHVRSLEPLNVDWRGSVRLKPDDIVVLGIQATATLATALSGAFYSMYSRALVNV